MDSISPADLKIFNDLTELLVKDEFRDAQFDFFEKNQETFEDTEENKLEHSEIFKAYQDILDKVIEVKLLETCSDEDLKAFYESFAKNLKNYETVNSDTVDTLFSF